MENSNCSVQIVDIITIVISVVALLIAVFKDFLLPYIYKPKLKFDFDNKEPFRRFITLPKDNKRKDKKLNFEKTSPYMDCIIIDTHNYTGPTYDVSVGDLSPNSRILDESLDESLQETQKSNANEINCCFLRISVNNSGKRTAQSCRCQISDVQTPSGERFDYKGFTLRWACRPESILNPTNGERLSIGVGETEFIDFAMSRSDIEKIFLLKYHGEYVGLKDTIEPGEYIITLIFSGDNFRPYLKSFRLFKDNSKDINGLKFIK
jgi:hypothetical protein